MHMLHGEVMRMGMFSEAISNLFKKPSTRLYPTEKYVPLTATRGRYVMDATKCIHCSLCTLGCPAGLSAHGYVAFIKEGMFKEALDLIRETVPLPSVIGRVCHHPCEGACNRKDIDEPVSICALKAFVGDEIRGTPKDTPPVVAPRRKEKVAVVGAGPAGLAAAFKLARKGYQVTIYEASAKPGGMLWWGIPDYRLPKKALQGDVDYILSAGIAVKYGVTVGRDITLEQLRKEHNAVFLAIGAHKSLKLGIPGEDLQGVIHGIDFLHNVAAGERPPLGKKVAVIGGGNAAMDAVRSASRLGSEAFILYRRTKDEMPAIPSEVLAAEEEGIKIHYLVAPVRIVGENGRVKAIECQKMQLGEPDASGRRKPVPIKGSEFLMEVDNVIPAVSQAPDLKLLNAGDLKATKWDSIDANPGNMSTSLPGVFAAGDAVTGPASAIEAIAGGNKAAIYIDRFLRGQRIDPDTKERDLLITPLPNTKTRNRGPFPKAARFKHRHIALEKRKTTFEEVEAIMTRAEALAEAGRCMNCEPCYMACPAHVINVDGKAMRNEINMSGCILCYRCADVCPTSCIEFREQYGAPTTARTNIVYQFLPAGKEPPKGTKIEEKKDAEGGAFWTFLEDAPKPGPRPKV